VLGIKTGDIVLVESPMGSVEVPAVVTPAVASGVIAIPYGMGRWAETLVVKPGYLSLKKGGEALAALPDKVEIPETAVNPVKHLPEIVKKTLFTNRPADYFEKGLEIDAWRFNGVSSNPIQLVDESLGGWSAQSWIGASQVYYSTPVRIMKTGKTRKLMPHQIVW
jgi:anaerobic selenocysteine-containing dehydrogenase